MILHPLTIVLLVLAASFAVMDEYTEVWIVGGVALLNELIRLVVEAQTPTDDFDGP